MLHLINIIDENSDIEYQSCIFSEKDVIDYSVDFSENEYKIFINNKKLNLPKKAKILAIDEKENIAVIKVDTILEIINLEDQTETDLIKFDKLRLVLDQNKLVFVIKKDMTNYVLLIKDKKFEIIKSKLNLMDSIKTKIFEISDFKSEIDSDIKEILNRMNLIGIIKEDNLLINKYLCELIMFDKHRKELFRLKLNTITDQPLIILKEAKEKLFSMLLNQITTKRRSFSIASCC